MTFRRIFGLLVALLFICGLPAFALKNVCNVCATVAQDDDLTCKKCGTVINACLDCGCINPMKNDVCASCSANLDEMRSLAQIDPEIRDDLRLGQTDRSQLERALGRLDNLMKKHPEQLESLLFRKGEVYFQLKNWGRAVSTWREYLAKFPKSPRLPILQASLAETLCKIGWSRFEDRATEEALARFIEATEANPMNDNAWRLVAQMYRELGQKDKAGDAYMKALEANPGHKSTIGLLRQMKRTIPPELLKPRPKPAIVASATAVITAPLATTATGPAEPVAPATATAAVVPTAGGEVVIAPNVTEPGAVASIPPAVTEPAPMAASAPVAGPAIATPTPSATTPTPPMTPVSTSPSAAASPAVPAPAIPEQAAPAPVAPPVASPPALPASQAVPQTAVPVSPVSAPTSVASIPAPAGQP